MAKTKSNSSNEYLKTKVMTASAEELQLILYDGLLRFCEKARTAIQDKRIEESYTMLSKAQRIVMELMCSMKIEIAPDVCENLRLLYMFCYERLTETNLTKDIEKLDEAIGVIHHIRETWKMLMETLQQERQEQADMAGVGAVADEAPLVGAGDELAMTMGSTINFEG